VRRVPCSHSLMGGDSRDEDVRNDMGAEMYGDHTARSSCKPASELAEKHDWTRHIRSQSSFCRRRLNRFHSTGHGTEGIMRVW
jgi:hypothetical protein